MKTIKTIAMFVLLAVTSFFVTAAAGVPALALPLIGAGAFASFNMQSGLSFVGLTTTQLTSQLGAYFRSNNKQLEQMIYQKSQVAKYMKTITGVKGKYPALHTVTGNLVQGFASTWNAIGSTSFKANELVAYRQKVNYEFVPDDIENTWLAELFVENKTRMEMPITKYIIEKEIMPRVQADVEYLMGRGSYNSGALSTFGNSMDGIATILAAGLASSDQPMYKMPIPAFSSSTMVTAVEKFEDLIPTNIRSSIAKIYMSTVNRDAYLKDMRNTFGSNWGFTRDQTVMTYTGQREIVGLDCLNGTNYIFATPDSNFIRLIDIIDRPLVTDVQAYDYKIKVFMDFWLGVGFAINQLVLVGVSSGSGSGLTTEQSTYYLPGQV